MKDQDAYAQVRSPVLSEVPLTHPSASRRRHTFLSLNLHRLNKANAPDDHIVPEGPASSSPVGTVRKRRKTSKDVELSQHLQSTYGISLHQPEACNGPAHSEPHRANEPTQCVHRRSHSVPDFRSLSLSTQYLDGPFFDTGSDISSADITPVATPTRQKSSPSIAERPLPPVEARSSVALFRGADLTNGLDPPDVAVDGDLMGKTLPEEHSAHLAIAPSRHIDMRPASVTGPWEYLKGELLSTDYDESPDLKKDRVENFLSVPWELEKLMFFGYMICLDSFLHVFTILPLRIAIASWTMTKAIFSKSVYLKTSQKCDLLKGALIGFCCYLLQHYDASQIYHSVRGQALIKLYVIFNSLEICDKLCSAFGHDILDSLFSKANLSYSPTASSRGGRRLGRVKHFLVAFCYVFTHSIVLFYQVMTLNVSINSYNNALLTLLMSNQFVEIKGSVFKRFERENLFQLSCADIVERFQLSVFLCIITLRNFVELTGGLHSLDTAVSYFYSLSASMFAPSSILAYITALPSLPSLASFLSTPAYKLVETLATPIIVVFGTEVLVDWLKHAFICKFNGIRSAVYVRFGESLGRDLVDGIGSRNDDAKVQRKQFLDHSPAVARRIGFVSIPLACLVIRVTIQTIEMLFYLRQENSDEDLSLASPVGLAYIVEKVADAARLEEKIGIIGASNAVLRVMFERELWMILWQIFKANLVWVGIALISYLCLLMCKLFIGLFLQRRAMKRYMASTSSTTQPGGFADHHPGKLDIKVAGNRNSETDRLDSVARFSMVKSRIV
ncbi:hypothetical protein HDU85_004510 [Gaertneriomyces sp. JEL0708]|nr:hypothetical protein HDU85_004510 [Gaertneriomyces sp. JEL0708]